VDDIRVAPDDFRRQRFGAGRILLSAVAFDLEVLSLDPPNRRSSAEKAREFLLSLCSCKSALGSAAGRVRGALRLAQQVR
jgi:hypothetical protein